MDCLKPIGKHGRHFECGKCPLCLRYRRRVWTHRLILEAKAHEHSSFATLTYAKNPPGNSLRPLDVQNWLKELRHAIEPQKIRFFLSGEYGSSPTYRPHYHCILFGLDAITAGGFDGNSGVVQSTWGLGFTTVRSLTASRCSYTAGYVDKKITQKEPHRDPRNKKLYMDGRYAQFIRMSLRPGIGRQAADIVSKSLDSGTGLQFIQSSGGMPTALRHGKLLLPLGRYLRGKVLDIVSGGEATPEKGTQYRQTLAQLLAFERMQGVRADDEITAQREKKSYNEIVLDRIRQKCKNYVAKQNQRGGTL